MATLFDYINWIAVLFASLVYFMLGAIWYSKLLFARPWARLNNINRDDPAGKKGLGSIMLLSFIFSLLACTAIAVLRSRLDITGAESGLKLGLLTGTCIAATSVSNSYLYEKRPAGLYLINGGYTIAGNIIAAIIICIWA